MKETFADFMRSKRLSLNLGLRQFAKSVGMQPSNYCNVEAGTLPPPSNEMLGRIAEALRLARGSEDEQHFYDLAGQSRDEIPADVAGFIKENEAAKVLLRTVNNNRVTEKQIRGIIRDIESGKYKRA